MSARSSSTSNIVGLWVIDGRSWSASLTQQNRVFFVLTETEVEAGETGELTLNAPAGTYQIICALDTHFDAGMEGTLTVE
jgi:uncharacterized cupredoxin-like copper-binding protein